MGVRITGGAVGLATGVVGGLVWTAIEMLLGWWSGSVVPSAILRTIVIANVAGGAAAGLVTGLVVPNGGRRLAAVVLVGAYGLMRVYAPPGMGAEVLYVLAFGVVAAVVLRVGGVTTSWIGVVLTIALGTTGVLLGDAWLDEHWEAALHGRLLPVLVAGIAAAPLLVDGLLAFVFRSTAVRAGVVCAAGLLALVVTAKPLSTGS